MKNIEGAEEFYEYLEVFVYREENGDIPNGYGGFIRKDNDILFNLDLRTYTSQNRVFFWQAAERALAKLKVKNDDRNEGIETLFVLLLDMHKRYIKGEDPMLLNDFKNIQPASNEKSGPGW